MLRYLNWLIPDFSKPGICTVFYRYFFFLINIMFVLAGIGAIGFGVYGIIKVRLDGLDDPILLCADPAFLTLILGILTVLISINGALGFLRCHTIMLNFFAVILIILFFVFFVGTIVIWAMNKPLKKFFKFLALTAVHQYNPEQRWALSGLVDTIQNNLKCCGGYNYTDWTRNNKVVS
jgi:hypothetical protein